MTDWRTLTKEQAFNLPEPDNGAGIYFLWYRGELVYIGASRGMSVTSAGYAYIPEILVNDYTCWVSIKHQNWLRIGRFLVWNDGVTTNGT